jgi:hypothetical protein
MATARGHMGSVDFSTNANPAVETIHQSNVHTGEVAVPATESVPLPLLSIKDVVKHGSPMCPIVNSTLSCGLQTLVPPCSVPVNKFCFSASDCTLQHGLPKAVGHEPGTNILGVFTV